MRAIRIWLTESLSLKQSGAKLLASLFDLMRTVYNSVLILSTRYDRYVRTVLDCFYGAFQIWFLFCVFDFVTRELIYDRQFVVVFFFARL